MVHEAQLHQVNSYITLTYADTGPSLNYEDFQKFMKRLRRKLNCFDVTTGQWVPRFFCAGEYGDKNRRPHFHAILFGVLFPRSSSLGKSPAGFPLWRSELLESFWPYGYSSIGDVSFESAAYVARYVMKKVNGKEQEAHYRVVDRETGEVEDLVPEFCHMSLKPGIGARWLEQHHRDIYGVDGYVRVRGGKKSLPPKYYDKWFKRIDPLALEGFLEQRALDGEARLLSGEESYARLRVREQVSIARSQLSLRRIEK
uniref:Replication protein VP4 n=1 Tax=Gokushovirinae environmental samples TaxID=1478972 RepID=A0A2R3UAB0_9VIRU|nr:replication protein VP4 [Gokushovirinae environmental samples]